MALHQGCCTLLQSRSGRAAANHKDQSMWTWLASMVSKDGEADKPPRFPSYWTSSRDDLGEVLQRTGAEEAEGFYPVPEEDSRMLERLLNRTNKESDRTFKLVRAVRVEQPELWRRYQTQISKMRRRSRCTFNGKEAPMTTGALAGVRLSDGFPEDLDADINEAYLWHGTKPLVALRIVQEGFDTRCRSRLGKRFGAGGYFSEEAAKADSYAGAGEGIYKDCFAMLLCRVALGRQLHTAEFRWEGASQKAAGRFDSILAEPRGTSYREFVALDSAQIYPEFALVYERCEVPEPEGFGRAGPQLRRCLSDLVPNYWSNAPAGESFFRGTFADPEMEPSIQSLMDSTWIRAFTWERKDSKGSMIQEGDPNRDMPEGLRVLKVLRVEHSEMWQDYKRTLHALREESAAREGAPGRLGVETAQEDVELCARGRLASDVNEEYLWHGCTPQVAMSLAQDGFSDDPGCGGTGRCRGLFGRGVYFVESASKADEHSEDDKEGYYRGQYAMLLCRVLLGHAKQLDRPDLRAHESVGRGSGFDSVVGLQEASDGTFREFVVPTRAQIYPEYAIVYERRYSVPRVR